MVAARILALTILFGLALSAFAASPAAGNWKCVSTDIQGHKTEWTIVIQEEAGALSGYLEGHEYRLELVSPKFEDGRLKFQISINGKPHRFDTTIRGNNLEGTYEGAEASGSLKGAKAP